MEDFLHIIKTNYKNDSRLTKWVDSLSENDFVSEVFILQDDNIQTYWKEGRNTITATKLFSRKFFAQRKGYLIKVPELAIKTLMPIKKSKSQIVIFHDLQQTLSLLYVCLLKRWGIKKKKIVWDLHELPHEILTKNYFSRKIIRFILNTVDLIIYTNIERRHYILEKFGHTEKKYVILNNYTEKSYKKISRAALPIDLEKWLDKKGLCIMVGECRN